nr:hypothetical protein [Tanacetum cinerariifolium]
EVESLFQQERQTENINSTNSFNTVSSPVNTVRSTFVNAASQTPIKDAGPSASTNAFKEHSFERFSFFKIAFSLPHVPIMTPIDDTGMFGNAYDDEVLKGEVDMNNVDSSYTITEATKNKKDERGILIKNKARLVTQGHTQEEGIDYDEVFAPVSRIEAIRLFLAYDSFKNFVVYQMDFKSAFLYGRIEEEVYVYQPPGFEDPNFPDKVYKVEKALYGLHQAPRACKERVEQDKYVAEVLKKFDFVNVKTASTPMESNKPLIKDKEAKDVDVHLYRSMIGSLMYLTASRPDITFAVCACASLDRKSTTEGCQFLGKRLISWQCKKQTIVANSITEAEYVAAANCCGQKTQKSKRKQRKEAEISHDESKDKDHVPTPFSDPLPSGEDSSILNELMGKMIEEIDQNAEIALDDETQGRINNDEMFGVDDLGGEEVVMDSAVKLSIKPKVVVQEQEMSTTIPAAGTTVTTVVPTLRAKCIVFHEQKQSQIPTVSSLKDKGKAKMIEPEKYLMRVNEEYARKLQAEEQEAARLSRAQQDKEANNSWDNMQAMMDADGLLAEKLQAREREEFYEVQKVRLLVKLIEKIKKHFTAMRAQKKRNKPPTKTQMKSQMSTYLKHMGGYKQSHLKGRSFDEIKKLFDREMRKVNDFIAMDSEVQKSSAKEAQESSTKRTSKHLESDISKKQKIDKNVKPVIDDSKELKKCMEIVLDDGDEVLIEATPISSRSPTIIDYKIHNEGKKNYFKIIRADVKNIFKKKKPVDDMDNLLFRTLKTMFEHHVEDTIWTYQQGLAKVIHHSEVFGNILLMKTKILIKKLEDSDDEYQV